MKKVQITISSDAPQAKVFKKYLAEKAAFKNAVTSGTVASFTKKNGIKFDSPISGNK